MKRSIAAVLLSLGLVAGAASQEYPEREFPAQLPAKQGTSAKLPAGDNTPPRSPDSAGESSSKATKIDLSPPSGQRKERPDSAGTYNPHRAAKAIEVGDFYFKKGSYLAALSRYREALQWKANDAEATFKAAQTYEKLGRLPEARVSYQSYLKILPEGPHASEARKALDKLH